MGTSDRTLISGYSSADDADRIAADLAVQLGAGSADVSVVVLFHAHDLDGAAIAAGLADRLPSAEVIGCSTAGEFTETTGARGGAAAVAFPRAVAPRVATALADLSRGVTGGVEAAVASLEARLGTPLRDLDPERYVGLLLIDGLTGREEDVNVALGRTAPFLSFVGGSAGDDLRFERTSVTAGGTGASDAAALAVLELAVPFQVFKSCSFEPDQKSFTVTRADPDSRTVYELDGQPVLAAYAAAVGTTPEHLDNSVFMAHPFGVMIDNQPWIRSPQRVTADGGMKFYCRLPEGTHVNLMNSTDLIGGTHDALEASRRALGGKVSGAVVFNCILRRLELDAKDQHEEFLKVFDGVRLAGAHTYGESWLGHMNQTCTALLIG